MDNLGRPPEKWARLVCELLVEDIDASISFWRDTLGFSVAYRRPAEKFAYLDLNGAQVMLCQRSGKWETGPLDRPFGRGVMFQIAVDDLDRSLAMLSAAEWPIHSGPREVWRQAGSVETGGREVFVQDPDGYLLMLAQDLGQRPVGGA